MSEEFDSLRTELAGVSDLPASQRNIALAAVLTKAFQFVGYNPPTVVGGSAVEFWTRGGIGTKDLDMLLFTPHEKVDQVMCELGFERRGKDWHHTLFDFLVEYPDNALEPGFTYDEIEALGTKVRIISREAIIVDRIDSHQATGYELDGLRALLLFGAADCDLDWDRIEAATRSSALPLAKVKAYESLALRVRNGELVHEDEVKSALYDLSRG